MKCLYYLISSLDNAHAITSDLRDAGIVDWSARVYSKKPGGTDIFTVCSGSHRHPLDMPRVGLPGVLAGFLFGLLTAALLDSYRLFGTVMPLNAYLGLTLFWSVFGAWEGGLAAIFAERRKIALLRDELDTGRSLLLICAEPADAAAIESLVSDRHPEVLPAPHLHDPLTGLVTQLNDCPPHNGMSFKENRLKFNRYF